MILNRKEQPMRKDIGQINFLKAKSHQLENGVGVHSIHQENQSIVKLEISFEAGTIYQPKPLIASTTNALLIEGSKRFSSLEIAEFFDEEGAFLETSCTLENASVTLYCLTSSLSKLLPRLKEVIFTPEFSEEELKSHLSVQKQKFMVNNEKVAYVAKKEFLPFLLGKENAYNSKVEASHFDEVTREDLLQFFQSNYSNQRFEIFLSGNVGERTLQSVEETFSNLKIFSTRPQHNSSLIDPPQEKEMLIQRKGAIQSAIRIGNVSIGRKHEDFPKLYLANTILGGYFGSRLMNNIREDKGYTYGIGSGLISLKHLSYFVISTEVGAEVTKATLREIQNEMNKMCEESVALDELVLVKNYVLGNILRGFDGAFAAMDRFKMLHNSGLDYTYYENLITTIQKVSSVQIREVCQKYLQFDFMKKVIVGKI